MNANASPERFQVFFHAPQPLLVPFSPLLLLIHPGPGTVFLRLRQNIERIVLQKEPGQLVKFLWYRQDHHLRHQALDESLLDLTVVHEDHAVCRQIEFIRQGTQVLVLREPVDTVSSYVISVE